MQSPTKSRLAFLLTLTILLSFISIPASPTHAQSGSQTFPETGKIVKGKFLTYWRNNGGLPQQGFPISNEMQETSPSDGKTYTMQYFERAVFEAHPENPAPNDVLLSLLGTFQYAQKYPGGAPDQEPSTDNAARFPETGKSLGGIFRTYWNAHGGLRQQGFPISDEFVEQSDLDGEFYVVQYFERAVFEYHPENPAPYDVLLSQLGTFQYRAVHGSTPPIEPAAFTAEEVNYFVEVALGTEFHSTGAMIAKWEKPVKIIVQGTPTKTDSATVHAVADEINAILGTQMMTFVDQPAQANMKIIFDHHDNFSTILPEYVEGNLGYFYFWFGNPQSIDHATVLITTEGVTQQERSHLIREEVTQALGLARDSNTYPDSIFYQPWTDTNSYAEIDKKLIKMLYLPEIKPTMTEPQVRAILGHPAALYTLQNPLTISNQNFVGAWR